MCATDWIIALASLVTACATVAIWLSARASLRLSQEIARATSATHAEYNKLLLYPTTATIVSGKFGGNPQDSVNQFKSRLRMMRDTLQEDDT